MSTPRNSNTPRVSTQDITEVAALASQRRRTPTEAGAVKVPHTVFVDLEPKMAAMASKLSPSQSRARKILEDSARRLATSKSPRTPRRSIASPKTKAEDDAIMELSLSIKHREAEVNSIRRKIQKQQQLAEETNGSNDAYTLLLVQYMEREEELRVALNEKKALGENVSTLKKQVIELKKFGNKNATDVEKMDKMEEEWRAMAKKVTTLQMEITLQNRAIATFEDMIKNKNAEIERVTREKEDVINERTQLEDIVKTLSKVKEEADITEAKAGAATAALESNAILISMQKERLQEQSMLIKTYEKRFLTKGMDLPKILSRADEGDRIWSRINEREKKYKDREVLLGVLRDENESLSLDKRNLQVEIDQFKLCFDKLSLKMEKSGDNPNHLPWMTTQLRENISLKEKINELEEIILHEGYTIKALDAELDFRSAEVKLKTEMDNLTSVIDMLKSHQEGADDDEFPVLIGKLEEALHKFGIDVGIYYQDNDLAVSTVSSASSTLEADADAEGLRSLHTANTHDSWIKQGQNCFACTPAKLDEIEDRIFGDIKDDPQYLFSPHEGDSNYLSPDYLSPGEDYLSTNGDDDMISADEEDADYEVSYEASYENYDTNDDDVDDDDVDDEAVEDKENPNPNADESNAHGTSTVPRAGKVKRLHKNGYTLNDSFTTDGDDVHIQKVHKLLSDWDNPEDWRKWVSPPTSPGPTIKPRTSCAVLFPRTPRNQQVQCSPLSATPIGIRPE